MKFSISSSDLLKQLQLAHGAVGSNAVIPILEDFLFTVQDGKLEIAATDLEISMRSSIPVEAIKDGSVAVPARILLDTVKALPAQPITFTSDEENMSITIQSSYGKYKMAGESSEDFPRLPEVQGETSIRLDAAILEKGINKTIFATSSDELRPAMTGVLFQLDFNKLIFVATDAHKLVKYTFSEVQSDAATSFIVPKKALNLLKNALANYTGEVSLSYNKANAFFKFGDATLTCRLIDARYPDYNAVIPQNNNNKLLVDRADFQNSLKRIAIYSNKSTNQVVLEMEDNNLRISAQDLDFSNEADENISCSYADDKLRIGFNAKFLIDMLNVLEGEEVRIDLSTPTRAGLISPSHHEANEEILMLVMPVMLSN